MIKSRKGRQLQDDARRQQIQDEFEEMMQQVVELDELFQKAAKELEDLYKDPRYKDEDD